MTAVRQATHRKASRSLHPILRAACGEAAITVLCLMVASGCASLPAAERQQLIDACRDYNQGDITTATAALDRLIRDFGNTSEIAEAYYVRGLCRFISQQPQAAGEDFERGISISRRVDLTARCQAGLAAVAFQSGDWERAANLYEESIGQLPDVPPTDAVLYAAGVSMQRAGHWQRAAFPFARILNRFRNRPIAADARRMAEWRNPYYSIQLGAYRDADSAEKASHEFRQQGFDASRDFQPRDGASLWVVLAGRYQTYRDAQAALADIRSRQRDAFIVP